MEKNRLTQTLLLFATVASVLVRAQQPYLNNKQLACETKDANITNGFLCNGLRKSCLSYVSFRSAPPYDSAVTIAYLLGAEATQIASLNNLTSDVATIPFNTLLLVPFNNCSCSGDYYQHNSTYKIKDKLETYFTISNNTYQGLTTCQAMEAQNPIDFRDLVVGDSLIVPLRCACPTSDQTAAGFKSLLSYMVTWRDSISAIVEKFGADEQAILDANELTSESIIFPFTPILVPLTSEPKIIQTYSPPAPAPQTPSPAAAGQSRSAITGGVLGGVVDEAS